MRTIPIYLTATYVKTLESKIIDVKKGEKDNEYIIILDQTIFYPMGGGQPTDQGFLTFKDDSVAEVYQVQVKNDEIFHFVRAYFEPKVGEKVSLKIDWERRYKNMKVHSAGHIVDFALYTLGVSPGRLSPYKGDHGKKPFIMYIGTPEHTLKEQLQEKVNDLIKQDLKFSWNFSSIEDLSQKAIYMQPNLPKNKPLRMLELEGIGAVADGGTIVNRTSEVQKIIIEKIEVKNNETCIYYSVSDKIEPESDKSNDSKTLNTFETNTMNSKYNFDNIIEEVKTIISEETNVENLTNIWRNYLGKEGKITELLKGIKDIPNEDKKEYGQLVNNLKNQIDDLINNAKSDLNSKSDHDYLNESQGELTFTRVKLGHMHPLTQTINDLNDIFRKLGYSIMDGPEIETDEYCFQRRNVPLDHPARDLQDTIYVEEPNVLLRTQTSSIEARAMELIQPPYKLVMPGRVYRNEKVNRSNHFMFHQYQLSVVKEKVSMAELFATIKHLFKEYLGEDVVVRFRCKYYPEVEPGVGPDMQCFNCHGEGCPICKYRGWLEMGGAGILHPKVLSMAGIDPTKWQGYAFGLGLDRWAMAKHKITDIRTLLGGNLSYKPEEK